MPARLAQPSAQTAPWLCGGKMNGKHCHPRGAVPASGRGAEGSLTAAGSVYKDICKGVWRVGETTGGWSEEGSRVGAATSPGPGTAAGGKAAWAGVRGESGGEEAGAALQLTYGSSEGNTFLGLSLRPPPVSAGAPGRPRARSQDTLYFPGLRRKEVGRWIWRARGSLQLNAS